MTLIQAFKISRDAGNTPYVRELARDFIGLWLWYPVIIFGGLVAMVLSEFNYWSFAWPFTLFIGNAVQAGKKAEEIGWLTE